MIIAANETTGVAQEVKVNDMGELMVQSSGGTYKNFGRIINTPLASQGTITMVVNNFKNIRWICGVLQSTVASSDIYIGVRRLVSNTGAPPPTSDSTSSEVSGFIKIVTGGSTTVTQGATKEALFFGDTVKIHAFNGSTSTSSIQCWLEGGGC